MSCMIERAVRKDGRQQRRDPYGVFLRLSLSLALFGLNTKLCPHAQNTTNSLNYNYSMVIVIRPQSVPPEINKIQVQLKKIVLLIKNMYIIIYILKELYTNDYNTNNVISA